MSNGDAAAGVPSPAVVISVGAALLQQGKVLPSFAQFAVTGEDNLQVFVVGSVPGLTLLVQGRFLDVNQSQVIPFSYPVTVPSNRVPSTALFSLGTGYLLNLTAFTTGTPAPLEGQVYVLIQMIRGLTGATFLLGTLVGGYVTNTQPLGWPGSPITTSLEGPGAVRNIIGTTPGTGLQITETCPTGARWLLRSTFCQLTTDAVVATRYLFLQLDDSVHVLTRSIFAAGQPANLLGLYTAGGNFPILNDALNHVYGLPYPVDHLLRAGDRFVIGAVNLDALDNFGPPQYQVSEWLEP